jgi:EpsI family protein
MVAAMGIAAVAVRSMEPMDPGPLGLEQAVLAGPDSSFVEETLDPDFLDLLRPREILYRTYGEELEAPVWVFLAYFDRQKEGSQVHSPRHCYPGSGWNIEREIEEPLSGGGKPIHGLVVDDGTERRLVCYWYQTPGGIVSDVVPLKLALMRNAILRRPQDVVFANVSTPLDTDAGEAFSRIVPYALAAQSEINRLYREQDERQSHPL